MYAGSINSFAKGSTVLRLFEAERPATSQASACHAAMIKASLRAVS
jgi:hypothetical protein